jgi:DNA-binding transcriptional MerR regulator
VKLAELAKKTGVSKDTIHYYIREGLLPKPRLKGKRLADYDQLHIDRIDYIKELQEKHDLPISVIKQILRRQKRVSKLERSLFRLQSKYFSPRAHLLAKKGVNEEAFREATGLNEEWLGRFESWGIITPSIRDNEKVYSQEDITLGKLIVEMDYIGMGPKDGFNQDALKHFFDYTSRLIQHVNGRFARTYWGKLSREEFYEKGMQALEISAIFFYHLYRKLCREDTENQIRSLEKGKTCSNPHNEPDWRPQ